MKRLVEDTFYITAREAARASNLDGFVRWFICPACQQRVGKLYLPAGEAVFLCRKCHDLAYRAQQLRAFKKPVKAKGKTEKQKYTKEDWLREARAFLEKMGRKEKVVIVLNIRLQLDGMSY
jgi:hypothetical protein